MARRLLCIVCTLVLVMGLGVTPAIAESVMEPPAPRHEAPPGVDAPKETHPAEEPMAPLAVDDTFPGEYRDWYDPISDTVDWEDDRWDIFPIYLEEGENVRIDMTMTTGDADLYLWPPGTTSTGDAAFDSSTAGGTTAEQVSGTVPAGQEGYWFVGVLGWSSTVSNYTVSTETYPDNAPYGAPDDYMPGTLIPAPGFHVFLDDYSEWAEILAVPLQRGQTITVTVARVTGSLSTPGFNPWIMLFPPTATSIYDTACPGTRITDSVPLPKTFSYTAPTTGVYPLLLWHSPAGARDFGVASVTYSIDSHEVFRFYKPSSGVHFYTATTAERDNVIATLSAIYQYEGPVYRASPLLNGSPMWRFYRPSSGTHFYTADAVEKDRVINTLAGTYTYEGPAYNVSMGTGETTVWRFYRPKTGTHFYTADPVERDYVINNLAAHYTFEGPAFFVNQY